MFKTKNFCQVLLIFSMFLLINFNSFSDWKKCKSSMTKVTSIKVSGTKIYASTQNQGVFYSDNSGSAWIDLNSGLPSTDDMFTTIWDIEIKNNNIYAAVDGKGVYYSSNNGVKWNEINHGLFSFNVNALASNSNYIFTAHNFGIVYRSSDNGNNWELSSNDFTIYDLLTIYTNENSIYVAGKSGDFFVSTDNGNTWTARQASLNSSDINAVIKHNNILFQGSAVFGVFKSTNEGVEWQIANNGLKNMNITAFESYNNNIILGTKGEGVQFSTNNGDSWITLNNGLDQKNITCFAIDATYLYAGTNDGVWQLPLTEVVVPEVIAPELTLPADLAVNISHKPQFIWNVSNSAISYTFQLADNPDFQPYIIQKDQITNTSYTIPDSLKPESKYYWKVAAISPEGTQKWSSVFSFTTIPVLEKPVLSFPENESTNNDLNTILAWKHVDANISYRVILDVASEFPDPIADVSGYTDNSMTITTLNPNTMYYWIVIATDSEGQQQASDIWSFRTAQEDLPINIIYPKNNEVSVDIKPTFSWNIYQYADSYDFKLSKNIDFSDLIEHKENLVVNNVTGINLEKLTTYYWQITANLQDGNKKTSIPHKFTTSENGSSVNDINIDLSAEILPNPATDRISVCLVLDNNSDFNIKLYDNNGNLITNYGKRYLVAGENRFDLSINKSLPSGVYSISIISNKQRINKLLLIQK